MFCLPPARTQWWDCRFLNTTQNYITSFMAAIVNKFLIFPIVETINSKHYEIWHSGIVRTKALEISSELSICDMKMTYTRLPMTRLFFHVTVVWGSLFNTTRGKVEYSPITWSDIHYPICIQKGDFHLSAIYDWPNSAAPCFMLYAGELIHCVWYVCMAVGCQRWRFCFWGWISLMLPSNARSKCHIHTPPSYLLVLPARPSHIPINYTLWCTCTCSPLYLWVVYKTNLECVYEWLISRCVVHSDVTWLYRWII